MKTINRCSGCGGNLEFDPTTQSLKCKKCNSLTNIKKNFSYEIHEISTPLNKNKANDNYKCFSCGANLHLKKLEVTKSCPYCGTNIVYDFVSTPDGVIPFQFDEKTAINYLKEKSKKKIFAPKQFKKNPNINSIEAFYFPSFSFNCKTNSTYSGTLSKTEKDSEGNEITKQFSISGTKNLKFKNTFVESSSKLSQYDLELISPYNCEKQNIVKYSPNFIRGYEVENYDNSLENCKKIHDSIIKSEIKSDILSRYNYTSVLNFNLTTEFSDLTYSLILLPVYSIAINYKDKKYISFVNGQTGQLGGDFPKSKAKITLLIIALSLLFIAPFIIFFILTR